MYKTRFLVDTDIITNYLKGREIVRDFLMRIFDESVSGFFSVISKKGISHVRRFGFHGNPGIALRDGNDVFLWHLRDLHQPKHLHSI